MRYSLAVEERDYVPHPLPILFVGVFVLAVGFGINRYLTGSITGYSGHGAFLVLLGTITVFASAGSVDTVTQWKYGAGLVLALLGSWAIATVGPGLSASVFVTHLVAGLEVAAIVVGLLAVANSTARYRVRDDQPEEGV